MVINSAISDKPSGVFKTFPEFSKLTLGDRKKYEKLVADYPPLSEYAFPTLMNWWNTLDSCAIARLNGNIVISYWMPGSDKASGIALIGTNEIDASVCAIFDHLRSQGERARLVHVPEFVISYMQHPDLFKFVPERAYDEYIVDISKFYPIKHAISFRRHRLRKFLSNVDESQIIVKSLDLSKGENRQLLLGCAKSWPRKGTVNGIVKHSDEALRVAIEDAEFIGTENVCLYVGDEIQAYMLYHLPNDKRYATFSHAMVRYDLPYTYDYMVYAFSQWFSDRGVQYVNLDSDLGVPMLRMLKLALGPSNYFRKYTIEPEN